MEDVSERQGKLEYKGFSRGAWGADYMDPFTFLSLFYTGGESGTGWLDPKYARCSTRRTARSIPRSGMMLAQAEAMLDAQPIIPIDTAATNWVKKPYVKGMYPNAGSLFPWKYVYIERDPAKWDYGVPNMTAD